MSYIPDCRRDEFYNQKFLSGDNKEFIRGFDWCVEEAVDNFFSDNYDYDDGTEIAHFLNQKVPECLREKYVMEYTFGNRPDEERTVETYSDLIRAELLAWIESERNTMITGMINDMSDEEYAANGGALS